MKVPPIKLKFEIKEKDFGFFFVDSPLLCGGISQPGFKNKEHAKWFGMHLAFVYELGWRHREAELKRKLELE